MHLFLWLSDRLKNCFHLYTEIKMKKFITILVLLIITSAAANAQLTMFSAGLTTSFEINDREIRNLNGNIIFNNYDTYGWDSPTGSLGLNPAYYSGFYDYGTGTSGSDATGDNDVCRPDTAAVPEPTTLILIGIGLAGIGIRKRFSK